MMAGNIKMRGGKPLYAASKMVAGCPPLGTNTDPCTVGCCQTWYGGSRQDVTGGAFQAITIEPVTGLCYSTDDVVVEKFSTSTGAWVCTTISYSGSNKWFLGGFGTSVASICPPVGAASWGLPPDVGVSGPDARFLSPGIVECNDGLPEDCDLLPDVIFLDGIIDNIQTNLPDDVTKPIWDGTLTRQPGVSCSYYATVTPVVNDQVRVRQRDGMGGFNYAAMTIALTRVTGRGIIDLGLPGAFSFQYSCGALSLLGKYLINTTAWPVAAENTTDILLPMVVEVML